MDMTPCYREEDLFPREFTQVIHRPWGKLYHNADNPDSYDSNHALLYRTSRENLSPILAEIVDFYRGIGAHHVSKSKPFSEFLVPSLQVFSMQMLDNPVEMMYAVFRIPNSILKGRLLL